MGNRFKAAGGRIRTVLGVGSLLFILQSAWALDVVRGDFQQILNTRTDTMTVWQVADNPNIYVFDFPGLSYQGRSFNRITQFTEQQTTEPYPKVLGNQELARYIEAALSKGIGKSGACSIHRGSSANGS